MSYDGYDVLTIALEELHSIQHYDWTTDIGPWVDWPPPVLNRLVEARLDDMDEFELDGWNCLLHMDQVEGRCLEEVWEDTGGPESGPHMTWAGWCLLPAGHTGHHLIEEVS